uniref:Putative tetratricopeptide repeat protein 5-like polistes canadensis n=1 Tax=Xenopsylla cheopis TaxID=163159 RepID=A0A6M2DN38_XENCH
MTDPKCDVPSTKELDEEPNYEDKLHRRCSKLQAAVDALVKYKTFYFEQYPLSEANLKTERIKAKVEETTDLFKKYQDVALERTLKSTYYYQQGRALNVLDDYSPDALEILTQAIKLDAKNYDAWNVLGEVYWKNNDYIDAISCFEKANEIKKNKESLRNLSMLFRQLPQDICLQNPDSIPAKNSDRVLKALEYAQEALKLDPTDGTSWGILGNAYLAEYFAFDQNTALLRRALSAYNQSYKDPVAKFCSTTTFNHAMALKYSEEYTEAVFKLERAIELEPTWESAKDELNSLLRYVSNLQDLYTFKGRVRQKRLQAQIKSLSINDLGPLKNAEEEYKLISLADLKVGENKNCVVLGRLVGTIFYNDAVPFVFGLVDASELCVLFTVYNLIKNKPFPMGGAIAVANPTLEEKKFSIKSKSYHFKTVRIDNPLMILINGEQLSKNNLSCIHATFSSTSDIDHCRKTHNHYHK